MAITNNIAIWGADSDYGDTTWFVIDNHNRVNGFQPGGFNYATRMNLALKNATVIPYVVSQILAANVSGYTFDIDAKSITDSNLGTFTTNMKNAIDSYIVSKTVTDSTNVTTKINGKNINGKNLNLNNSFE